MRYVMLAIALLAMNSGVQAGRADDAKTSFTAGVCVMLGSLVEVAAQDAPPSVTLPFKEYVTSFTAGSGRSLEEWGKICTKANKAHNNFLLQTEA